MSPRSKPLKVAVLGGGAMGIGIAHATYVAGHRVTIIDPSLHALKTAEARLRSPSTSFPVSADISSPPGELHFSSAYDILPEAELIIEAVPEVLQVKQKVLQEVSSKALPSAVIASNTSTIPITLLGESVHHPNRFIGMHFFNPVQKMDLVEVAVGQQTSSSTVKIATNFVEHALKKNALVISDGPGFIVNRLLIPYILSAARMLDTQYCSAENIDEGMVLGCSMPIGPISLADYIGLDVLCHAADSIHAETNDPACLVPNNVRLLVNAGHLGRKSGQGFFSYAPKSIS